MGRATHSAATKADGRAPLRIVLVVPSYYPESNGGAEKQARLQALALTRLGAEVTILAPGLMAATRAAPLDDIPIVRIRLADFPARGGRYLLSTLSWTARVAFWLHSRRSRYDLIYVFHGRLHVFGPLIGAGLARKPIVVKPGGGGTNSDLIALRRKKGFYGHLVAHALVRWTTAFVAVSSEVAADLVAGGVPEHRIARISNGVVAPDENALKAALPPRTGKRMVFPTRLVGDKGVDVLLKAMALVHDPEVELTLVGDGPERVRFEALAAELGVSHRVCFLGVLEDVGSVLIDQDIFLSASTLEGQSNALLESLAFGLAPIVARASGVADVVEDGVTGYVVDPATPEGFTLAIARAIGLPEKERSALALRRFDTARERFAIDGVAERLLELFERLRVAA